MGTFKKKQLRDLKTQMIEKNQVQKVDEKVVDDTDVNVEIVNDDEEDKDVKDMLDNPVDNGKKNENVENEMDVSEKIMNDFANIAIESGKTKEELNTTEVAHDEEEQQAIVDAKENVDISNEQEDTNEDEVVDLLNMNVDEIGNEKAVDQTQNAE